MWGFSKNITLKVCIEIENKKMNVQVKAKTTTTVLELKTNLMKLVNNVNFQNFELVAYSDLITMGQKLDNDQHQIGDILKKFNSGEVTFYYKKSSEQLDSNSLYPTIMNGTTLPSSSQPISSSFSSVSNYSPPSVNSNNVNNSELSTSPILNSFFVVPRKEIKKPFQYSNASYNQSINCNISIIKMRSIGECPESDFSLPGECYPLKLHSHQTSLFNYDISFEQNLVKQFELDLQNEENEKEARMKRIQRDIKICEEIRIAKEIERKTREEQLLQEQMLREQRQRELFERMENERIEREQRERELAIQREKERRERLERELALQKEIEERERLERQRLERERLERLERERIERMERERLERQRLERERLERLERERLERLERERLERERLERQRLERERLEKERLERERLEMIQKQLQEKIEKERQERDLVDQLAMIDLKLEREKKEKKSRPTHNNSLPNLLIPVPEATVSLDPLAIPYIQYGIDKEAVEFFIQHCKRDQAKIHEAIQLYLRFLGLGYSKERIIQAIRLFDLNPDHCISFLTIFSVSYPDEYLKEAISISQGNMDVASQYLKSVTQLLEMGYNYYIAKNALISTNNNVDAAISKLLDGM